MPQTYSSLPWLVKRVPHSRNLGPDLGPGGPSGHRPLGRGRLSFNRSVLKQQRVVAPANPRPGTGCAPTHQLASRPAHGQRRSRTRRAKCDIRTNERTNEVIILLSSLDYGNDQNSIKLFVIFGFHFISGLGLWIMCYNASYVSSIAYGILFGLLAMFHIKVNYYDF